MANGRLIPTVSLFCESYGCTNLSSVPPGGQSWGVPAEWEQDAENLQSSARTCRKIFLHSSKLSWRGPERI